MLDNGSTGSLNSVAQLEAYRKFTGLDVPMTKIKDHVCVSAHGGSRCIGVAKFRFSYDDTVLEFDEPIVENTDSPLILGLDQMDRFETSGADQRRNVISFHHGS